MLKAAMVVAVILTESMRGCTWYPYSSQLSVCRKVAFLIWASSEAGDYVLAEQEVDAQEKMSGAKKNQPKNRTAGRRLRGCATDWSTWLGYLKIAWWESSFLRDSCDTRCLNCYLNHVFITRLPGNSILNLCNLYVKMRQSILIHFFWIIFMKLWLHELFFPFSSPLISLVSTHPVKLLFFVTHGFLVK